MAPLLALLAGPFVGSFLGVLIVRLPAGRPVAMARSACPACDAPLGPAELVPLLSYVVLRGRCRHCGGAIGRFHPSVELAATLVAAMVVAAAMVRGAEADWIWAGCGLGWTLLALGWIDWRSMRLPDVLTLPLLLLGLACSWMRDPDWLPDHAWACVAGYLGFRLVALAYRRLRGHDGMGAGDAKLLAAGGAWLGLGALPVLVLMAAVATLSMALLRTRGRLRATVAVPFGPGLAVSIWLLWLGTAPVMLPLPG